MPVDAIRTRMLAGLHEAGFTDLVPAHLAVMRYPGPQNQRPSEIAAEVGMSKQAVNYLLGQLETLGYLKREDHPGDQRSRRIRLTVRGRAAGRQIRKTVMQIEGELERELGAGHFAELRELLVRLNATDTIRGPRPERSRV